MGGGEDSDDAFRWMCQRSGGGDFLVVRARGNDDYNPYIQKLCHENSAATSSFQIAVPLPIHSSKKQFVTPKLFSSPAVINRIT